MLISPSDKGLRLSTDLHKSLQVHLYLPRAIFKTWNWTAPGEEDTQDDISMANLSVPLQQLLQVFEFCRPISSVKKVAAEASFTMEWNSHFDRLTIRFESSQIGH